MGSVDLVTTRYMRMNEVFADAWNFFMYQGRNYISPDSLVELDTKGIAVPYGGSESSGLPRQKTRDVIKAVTAMTDRKRAYLILGVENQTNMNYAMPVRNLIYDALQYEKQLTDAAASHKMSGDNKSMDSAEYLSGFTKDDKLMPVITLIIYFSPDEWDGPRSLKEMFGEQDEAILKFVQNYELHLIEPAKINEEDFSRFHSSLGEILHLIKISKDADKIDKLITVNERFKCLGRTEIDVINACFKLGLTMKEEDENMDMCSGFETLKKRAEDKGRAEGRAESVKNLMQSLGLTAEQAMNALKIPQEERENIIL